MLVAWRPEQLFEFVQGQAKLLSDEIKILLQLKRAIKRLLHLGKRFITIDLARRDEASNMRAPFVVTKFGRKNVALEELSEPRLIVFAAVISPSEAAREFVDRHFLSVRHQVQRRDNLHFSDLRQ